MGTALLHSAIVVEKRDALKGWTIFLAIVTFGLSLLGTFLVRSGVLTSVHAFAVDPARGVFILLLLVLVIGGSLALFAWRGPGLKGGGLFQPISREGGLLLNNLLLTTAAAAVLLGTLYPLFVDALGEGKISVGPPFFNAVFLPLMAPLVVVMAIGPLLAWKRGDLAAALQRLWGAALVALVALAFAWGWYAEPSVVGVLGFAMAGWLAAGTLAELVSRLRVFRVPLADSLARWAGLPRAAAGMTLAHLGLAVAIFGMTAAAVWKEEYIQVMAPGDAVSVAGYDVTFRGAAVHQGPNYVATRAKIEVRRDGRLITVLDPENRRYPVEGQQTTEAAIRSSLAGDLYAVIGEPTGDGGAFVTRVYFNPLVPWIWGGVTIMVIGGAFSLSDRRHRVGAPRRRAGAAPTEAAPAPVGAAE